LKLGKYPRLVSVGSHVLSWLKGKSPLIFKYEKLDGSGRDSGLRALSRFLDAYQSRD